MFVFVNYSTLFPIHETYSTLYVISQSSDSEMEDEEYISFQAPPLCLIVASSSFETLLLDGNDDKYHTLDYLNEIS